MGWELSEKTTRILGDCVFAYPFDRISFHFNPMVMRVPDA